LKVRAGGAQARASPRHTGTDKVLFVIEGWEAEWNIVGMPLPGRRMSMAQLYFRYSTMNAGKSLEILKIANNYEEQGKQVLLLAHHLENRQGSGRIASRVGISHEARVILRESDLLQLMWDALPVDCILIDEGQFLSRTQVIRLCDIVDKHNIPVIVYGLKNDFQNHLFEGSEALLLFADKIEEIKTVCWFCSRKAIMNMRISDGKPVREGEQIMIGGNESYVPVCRRCFHNEDLVFNTFRFFS
jgi:thymidine kinase